MTQALFLHIHKCGGTSIRHMLNGVYEAHEQLPVPIKGGTPVRPEYRTIDEYTAHYQPAVSQDDLDRYSLIMGHYDWRMVERVGKDVVVLTMLREPVAQLISQFHHFKRDRANYSALWDKLQYIGLEGFVDSVYADRFSNHQAKFLSGQFWGINSISNAHTTKAKRNIRKRAVYGLVERWDESIALFEEAIGKKLDSTHLNRHHRVQSDDNVSDGLIKKIEAIQSHDMSLYAYAVKHFEEQF